MIIDFFFFGDNWGILVEKERFIKMKGNMEIMDLIDDNFFILKMKKIKVEREWGVCLRLYVGLMLNLRFRIFVFRFKG